MKCGTAEMKMLKIVKDTFEIRIINYIFADKNAGIITTNCKVTFETI